MDGQAILESLDTLWFFSSIFTSAPRSPPSCGDVNTDQQHLKDPPRTEQPEARSPTLLKQPIQSPNTGFLVEESSESKDFSSDTEMHIMKSLLVEALESSPESPWKGRKPRKKKKCCDPNMKSRKNHKRKEVSEVGFSYREVGLRGLPVLVLPGHQRMEKTCGFQKLESLHMKIPPLCDGTAMKEHLKSWAHAVACTVK